MVEVVGPVTTQPTAQVCRVPVRRNWFLAATAFRASPYPPFWRASLTRTS